jgi:hypothetical protein
VTDPETILAEIKHARERVNHWKQWRNEPGPKKKLGHWRRRLKKALAAAAEFELKIPVDPFLPPPPPPTEKELHAAAVAEAKARVRFEWQVSVGQAYWSPWGEDGWSAVVLTELKRIWCRARRVDPRTGEVTSEKAKVRRDRLVKRDPALKGKDRPPDRPSVIVPPATRPAETAAPVPELCPTPTVERTPGEQACVNAAVAELLKLLDDDSTTSDW